MILIDLSPSLSRRGPPRLGKKDFIRRHVRAPEPQRKISFPKRRDKQRALAIPFHGAFSFLPFLRLRSGAPARRMLIDSRISQTFSRPCTFTESLFDVLDPCASASTFTKNHYRPAKPESKAHLLSLFLFSSAPFLPLGPLFRKGSHAALELLTCWRSCNGSPAKGERRRGAWGPIHFHFCISRTLEGSRGSEPSSKVS